MEGKGNMNYKLISGFSDEISPAIKEQFEELNKLGINYFEPRGIDGKNISKLTEEERAFLVKKASENNEEYNDYLSGKAPITDEVVENSKDLLVDLFQVE